MTPINYEFWGVSTISATIQDLNGLGLTTTVTTTTQIASITFETCTASSKLIISLRFPFKKLYTFL